MVIKSPKSCRIFKIFNEIRLRFFEGTITSLIGGEDSIMYNRSNENSIFDTSLHSEYSILKIKKIKGVFHIEGIMFGLKVTKTELIPDIDYVPREIVVQFKLRVPVSRILAILISKGLKLKEISWWSFLGFSALIEVPKGEEIYWMEQFQIKRIVWLADLNNIRHLP
jgi:hypothetical protein